MRSSRVSRWAWPHLIALLVAVGLRSAPAEETSPPADPTRHAFVEPHMGTLFQIVIYANDPAHARAGATAAFARIGAIDAALSDYRADSELSRLSQAPIGQPTPVGPDLLAIALAAQRIAERSDGAFDLTLGPLTQRWREARRTGIRTDEAELRRARAATGYRHLRVDAAARTLTLALPGMRLDAGGIAKGYAAQAALQTLAAAGLPRSMVAASGDLALGAAPPGRPGWTVALAPFGRTEPGAEPLVLTEACVSTSGDTEQFAVIDGVRYAHILDPQTGLGLTRPPNAVTVVARTGAEADAWATALSVLDSDDGLAKVRNEPGILAVIRHTQRADGSAERIPLYSASPRP